MAGLIRKCGLSPARCEFALEEVPLNDLIESLILEAHDLGNARNTFQYEAWRADGAPVAALREEYAATYDAACKRRPQDMPLLDNLTMLYADGEDVDPLVALPRDRLLSSGDKALIVVDGRHRTFAAAQAGVEHLPVFVLRRSDAVFSY